MKNETVHQHAKRIYELEGSISEIARSEGRRFEDFTASELVSTAENVLDIMSDWDDDPFTNRTELARQRRLLQNFIKKWAPKEVRR